MKSKIEKDAVHLVLGRTWLLGEDGVGSISSSQGPCIWTAGVKDGVLFTFGLQATPSLSAVANDDFPLPASSVIAIK